MAQGDVHGFLEVTEYFKLVNRSKQKWWKGAREREDLWK